jgi:ParB family chromosome partitioning protein
VSLAQKIVISGLSVRETEKAVIELTLRAKKPTKTKASSATDPDLKRLESLFSDKFNLSVEIKSKKRGGEIKIKFSQLDELDSFFKILDLE